MPDTEQEDMSISLEGEGVEGSPPPQLEMVDPTQDEYFTSYEDVEIHRLMVNDKPRTTAYADAIRKNKHLFQGKVAMDVGAGTGILSLFMAAAGAKKVYSVEASGMASVIEKVARDNGFGDIIKVLHTRVENVCLPNDEKVDIIVSEWMGFYLLHESMLNSVIQARDKFLSDDGMVFPSEARIYACPCSLQSLYREQINFWDDVYSFNMSAVKEMALRAKMVKPEVFLVPKSDLLADPTCVKTFNLRWVTEEEVKTFTETTFVGITRPGVYQGLCLWFECDFDGRDYKEDGEQYGSIVTLSTSPLRPPTHWKQTVVVLGYGTDSAHVPLDVSIQDNDRDDSESSGPKDKPTDHEKEGKNDSGNILKKDIDNKPSTSQSNDNKSENIDQRIDENVIQINKDYEVDEDEVVGWKLVFAQSADNIRHYTMTVEMLDPETEEHPIPCGCPMPRCMIIAKMMEREEMGEMYQEDDAIDCT